MSALRPPAQLAELAATVLIGVDRAGGASAGEVLSAAAAAATRARAGTVPAKGGALPAPCPAEELEPCSPRASAILSRAMIEGEWVMVEEWARFAALRARRVPERLVPAVMEACGSRPELAYAFGPALGRCGEWLGGFNPAWRTPATSGVPVDMEAKWVVGTAAERREWLVLVRRVETARAIRLIQSTWADDAASDRGAFVQILVQGLSQSDEPFLDSCLADRSKGVREAAAGLLCRLLDSAYVERMTGRTEQLLKLEGPRKGLLTKKGAKWAVEPPAEWDDMLAAHAVEERPPTGVGKRAWWLRQVVSAVPPSHWSAQTGLGAADLISALKGSEYESDVLIAWMTAAQRTGDVVWCRALAVHAAEDKKGSPLELKPLWKALPPEGREAVIAGVIEAREMVWSVPWEILGTADHAWSAEFSRRMAVALAASLPKKAADWWSVGPAIDAIALRIHPSSASEFELLVDKVFQAGCPAGVTKAMDRLRIRVEIHKEFAA